MVLFTLISRAYEVFLQVLELLKSPLLLIIRIIWGGLFILEGYDKFSDISSNAEYFESLGIPSPVFMVYLSASAEFFGGILMLIGLFSRIAAVPLIITMIVAATTDPSQYAFLGQGSDATEGFLSQVPLVFAYMTAVILFFGAGKISLDNLLQKRCPLCR